MAPSSSQPLLYRQAALVVSLVCGGRALPAAVWSPPPPTNTPDADGLRGILAGALRKLAETPRERQTQAAQALLRAALAFAIAPVVMAGLVLDRVPADVQPFTDELRQYLPEEMGGDPFAALVDVQAWLASPPIRQAVAAVAAELSLRPTVPGDVLVRLVHGCLRNVAMRHAH